MVSVVLKNQLHIPLKNLIALLDDGLDLCKMKAINISICIHTINYSDLNFSSYTEK